MSTFNNFFNSIKNTVTHKKNVPINSNITINTSSESQEESANMLSQINDVPTPSSIHTNVTSKQSIELSFLFDMAYVAATADNLFYLPHPYKIHRSGKNAQKYADKYDSDLSYTDTYFKNELEAYKKLALHSESRMNLFNEIRKIYPSFCHNIEEKISEEDFEFYQKNKTNLKRCLYCSNPYSYEKSSEDVLFEYRDKLSKVIDTLDFSRACKIEDSFVLSELNIFLKKLSELSPEQQQEFSSKEIKLRNNETINSLDFVAKLQSERIDRIEKYSVIENLYNKIQKQSYLRLSLRRKKDKNVNLVNPKDLYTDNEIR